MIRTVGQIRACQTKLGEDTMTDTAALTDWTPIQHAGTDGGPIELMARSSIIMRLQDGLLVAKAKHVVRRRRSEHVTARDKPEVFQAKVLDDDRPSSDGTVLTHETDVILPPEVWSSDKLGFFDWEYWTAGDHRLLDHATMSDDYDGDHTTYYGIELREAFDLSGYRAGHDEVLSWCVDWLAKQRSVGQRTGENLAWPEFKKVARHVGLSREDVFRPAFRAAKLGKS